MTTRMSVDEADELDRLLRVHPGGRLVEQQKLRLGGERPRNLETALVAVREVARVDLGAAGEPAVREQLPARLARLFLLAPDPRRAEDAGEDAPAEPRMHAHENVLER